MPTRRSFLEASALLAFAATARLGRAQAPPRSGRTAHLTWSELPLPGSRDQPGRALVLQPAPSAPDRTYPGLVLFRGRGESHDPALGVHAWRTLYGLEAAYAKLCAPPLELDREQRRFIEPARLDALNAALRERPFSGLVLICPFTPNPRRRRRPEHALDRYAEWIEHVLLPAARAGAPLAANGPLGVDGCSMGGYVAAEVFVRKPHLFQSFGLVQPAFGESRVGRYAEHLAAALAARTLRGVHLETSTRDPFRNAVEAMGRALARRDAPFTLDVLPGPHDQPWLRAAGTLTMLAWHHATLG